MKPKSKRSTYIFLFILTIGLGLLSRTNIFPRLIYPYVGDFFYALMFFFIVAILFPHWSTLKVFIVSVLTCYFIELSQLYQADWINNIRSTRLGGLVLGFGFLWSDLISYTFGSLLGAIGEMLMFRNKRRL